MATRASPAIPMIWDVVRVPFPYTGRPVRQHRPALVIASPRTNTQPDLLWVLMITNADNRGWPGDVAGSDLKRAGLPVESLVRTEKIATIDARHADRIGQLPTPDRHAVTARLQKASGGRRKGMSVQIDDKKLDVSA